MAASVTAAFLPLSVTIVVYNALTIDVAVFAVTAGAILSAAMIVFDCMKTQNGHVELLTARRVRSKIPYREPVSSVCASSLRSILIWSPDGCFCRDHETSLP